MHVFSISSQQLFLAAFKCQPRLGGLILALLSIQLLSVYINDANNTIGTEHLLAGSLVSPLPIENNTLPSLNLLVVIYGSRGLF